MMNAAASDEDIAEAWDQSRSKDRHLGAESEDRFATHSIAMANRKTARLS